MVFDRVLNGFNSNLITGTNHPTGIFLLIERFAAEQALSFCRRKGLFVKQAAQPVAIG